MIKQKDVVVTWFTELKQITKFRFTSFSLNINTTIIFSVRDFPSHDFVFD